MITMGALGLVLSLAATAAVTVSDGEEVTVAVDGSGVTLQLPEVVRVVTPGREFVIQPVGSAVAARQGTRPQPGAVPEATDVRVFMVRPLSASSGEQRTTFLMGESRSVTVRFVRGGAHEENFVDLRWVKRATTNARAKDGEQFLGAERNMLLAMLRDEKALGRKVVRQRIAIAGYPDLEVYLVRSYEAEGLTGTVYTFTNTSSATMVVNQAVLAIGAPNRAVLTQMDHSELRPCSQDNSADPRGTGCMSAVRIVARTGRVAGVGTLSVATTSRMPFVLVQKDAKR